MPAKDRRFFTDATGLVVTTAFHALRFDGDEQTRGLEFVRACEHADMEEIVRPSLPARVLHFVLENRGDCLRVPLDRTNSHTTRCAWLESLDKEHV